MKKITSLFLSLLVMALLFGCGKKEQKVEGVTIWHWITDREDAFVELAHRYKEQTGTDVRFELYAPSDAYSSKVRAAAQTDTLPDIFGILGEKRDFAAFVNADHVLDLTEEMEKDLGMWKNSFFEKALAMSIFAPGNEFNAKPGIYGVPIDVTTILFVYNKDLFKKAGLDPENPPKNWNEFLEAAKKLKKAQIPGLVSGWGEIWMIDCLASNFAFNIMGESKVLATIKGDVPYTDPDWIKVFDLFRQMRDAGIYATGIVTMVNKRAELIFSNQQAALAFNGSWCVNVYKGMNPKLNYGTMLPPRVSDKHPVVIWGGAGSSFLVNAKSKNKQEAVKFLRWLTAPDQQIYLSEATNNLPSNKQSIASIPKILSDFAKYMDSTTHPSTFPVSEWPEVTEAFDKGIQSIIIGESTPEEIAKSVQEVKNKCKKGQCKPK